MKLLILSLFLFSLLACSTGTSPGHTHEQMHFDEIPEPQGKYADVLNTWTRSEKNYANFSSTFQVGATFLSPEVIEYQLYMDAVEFHWTSDKFTNEKQKAIYKSETAATVFVDFYTEREENNNLDKSKTDWNVFLDAGGKRVTPQNVKRVFETKFTMLNKYPYHNHWSTPYIITFPIATSVAVSGPLILTIAGPVGDAHLSFPNKK